MAIFIYEHNDFAAINYFTATFEIRDQVEELLRKGNPGDIFVREETIKGIFEAKEHGIDGSQGFINGGSNIYAPVMYRYQGVFHFRTSLLHLVYLR